VMILDESHKIKNTQTRWTQIVHAHKKFFEYRFALSGTPHPNHVGELYSQIKFLDDDLIDTNYTDFIRTIANVGTQYSDYEVSSIIEEKANVFLKRIKPYVIRRFLRDHLELPQVYKKNIYIELGAEQQNLYRKLVNEILISIKKERKLLSYREVQSNFPFILQILSDPCLLKGRLISTQSDLEKGIANWKFENSAKYQTCKEIVESIFEDNEYAKIVIWEEHPKTIDTLGNIFSKYGTVCIHGQNTPSGMSSDKWRDSMVQEVFRNDREKRILIANPVTLGTGTNLQFIQNVIIYSEDFSFVNKDQKEARTERAGMIGEVTYWKLIVDHSVEVYQDKVLHNKAEQDRLALVDGLTVSQLSDIFNGTFS